MPSKPAAPLERSTPRTHTGRQGAPLTRHDPFHACVRRALAEIPEGLQPFLENVVIQVEDWPPADLMAAEGWEEGDEPYGLYLGTPLVDRSTLEPPGPDRILIFRGPLEEDFEDLQELQEEIRLTVLHEIGHHFGLDEDRLEELGLG